MLKNIKELELIKCKNISIIKDLDNLESLILHCTDIIILKILIN